MRQIPGQKYLPQIVVGILFLGLSVSESFAQNVIRSGEEHSPKTAENPAPNIGSSARPEDRKAFTKQDSAVHLAIYRWNLDKNTNKIMLRNVDTLASSFRNDYPFFKKYTGATFLGNLGSPVIGFDYFRRPESADFLFWAPYEVYGYDLSNTSFFNTLTPFTKASYIWAGSRVDEEEMLELTHTQNITPRLNFSIAFKKAGTLGVYKRQDSKTSGLSVNLNYLGDLYSAHAGLIMNDCKGELNGGITKDSLITKTTVDATDHEVNLSTARQAFETLTLYASQSIDVPLFSIGRINDSVDNKLMTRLGHYFEYSSYGRSYKDDIASTDTSFYSGFFYNNNLTYDSTYMRKIENRIFIHVHPLKQNVFFESLYGGLSSKICQFKSMTLEDSTFLQNTKNQHELGLYAGISARYKEFFSWNAYGEYTLTGYRANDVYLKGELGVTLFQKSFPVNVLATGSIKNSTPDYFLGNYISNHFRWQNSFDKTNEVKIEGKLNLIKLGMEAIVSQSVLTDPVYVDNTGMPRQSSGTVSITSLAIRENLRFGPWNMNHRLLFQNSSDQEVMPLPSFAAQLSYYFDFYLVKNVLKLQIGADLFYNTAYKGYAFNPATGMYHSQNTTSFGNYPWVDFFVAAKWKVVTPFIKYEHADQGMVTPSSYFSALHYPRNPTVLKFGISWNFYD